MHIKETFDVIKRAHIATGHGGRDRMLKELGKKYVNVTRDSIELFKSMCIDYVLYTLVVFVWFVFTSSCL